MEFNYSALRKRILAYYGSIQAFTKATTKKRTFVSNVLNNKAFLTQQDIDEWCRLLDIPTEEIGYFFYAH